MLITELCKKGQKKKKIIAIFYSVPFIPSWFHYFGRHSANSCNPTLLSWAAFPWLRSPLLSHLVAERGLQELRTGKKQGGSGSARHEAKS